MRRYLTITSAVLALGIAACSSGGDADSSATPADDTDAVTSTAETLASDPPATEPAATDPAPSDPPVTESAEPDSATSEPDESPEPDESDESAGDRRFDVFVPSGYDAATPTPLILLLHGYTGSGDSQEAYFNFEPLAESRGFLYVHPDGTVDARGEQFWNATDACCSFGSDAIDDEAYLLSVIEQVSADYNVDPKAVFLAGHSNGGFMSYRMACRHADTIAGIASLAGATFADTDDCAPSEPVSVLQVHGTSDDTILFEGGSIIGVQYPGAQETVDSWVAYNGCDTTPTSTPDALDLDGSIDGAESDIDALGGCEQNTAVELWTIDGGVHVPPVTADFSASVVDFLLAHPKP